MQSTVDVTPTPRILRTLGDIPFEALKQLGLPVSEYHSYEIDKHAIASKI
jgi:hypothetical protein